jgi:Fic family protein
MKTVLKDIVACLADQAGGLSLEEICQALANPPAKRTLQRYLAQLIEQEQIIKKGQGPAVRYYFYANLEVELSATAEKIRREVELPVAKRKPVGYQQSFLQSYEPNKSHYLDEAACLKLAELGKLPSNSHQLGTYSKNLLNRLLIDLSWNSSRLEGNTYSLLETQILIEQGRAADGKTALETQMILNHKAAIEFLLEDPKELKIDKFTILNLHGLLANNLLTNPGACGALRKVPVNIGRSVYYPLAVPQLVEQFFETLLSKASQIKNPFEQSFFMLVQFAYLQAFEDVNKRVSRLAANIPFIQHNLSPIAFIDVSEQMYIDGLLAVYELNKTDLLKEVFIWAYERSAKRYAAVRHSLEQPDLFYQHYQHQIGELIRAIVQKQLNKVAMVEFIKEWISQHIAPTDQAQFRRVAEEQLSALHIGNIARFKLKLAEFEKWRDNL